MKERPILMSAPMVRATIAGTKTQTRRVVKITHRTPGLAACLEPPHGLPVRTKVAAELCPYGQPGDRLWVRETWQHSNFPLGPYDDGCSVFYRADYFDDPHGPDGEKSPEGKYRTWVPSIHMSLVWGLLKHARATGRIEHSAEEGWRISTKKDDQLVQAAAALLKSRGWGLVPPATQRRS